jgi:hypothetical protein
MRVDARLLMPVVGAAFVAALAGCGSDSPTTPSQTPSQAAKPVDVSALVAAAANSTYGGIARSLVLLPAYSAMSPVNTSACPFSSADQLFECAPATISGITFKVSYQLLDAGGHPLPSADATTLAAVRTITDVDGTTSFVSSTTAGITSTATIHSHSDNTLSGLLTNQHTLNGSTSERDTLTLSGSTATKLAITATTTVDKLDVPTKAGAYPATGTITTDATTSISLGGGTPVSTQTHASITFNGTSVVTITISVGSATQRCTLDLANPASLACTST